MIGGRTPIFLQQTDAECGLACLAMAVAFHDSRVTLDSIRERYPASQRGNTLAQLADLAADMGFVARGLKCTTAQLANVRLPVIAHWDLNHFVLVTRILRGGVEIVDPSTGLRRLTNQELGDQFTGYLLELQPQVGLNVPVGRPALTTMGLLRSIGGLGTRLRSLVAVGLLIELLGLSAPLLVQIGVDTAIQSTDRSRLLLLAGSFLVLTAIQAAAAAARELATTRLSAGVSHLMSLSAFQTMMGWSYAEIAGRNSGEVLSRFGSLDNVRAGLIHTTVQICLDMIMVVLALLLLSVYSVVLSCLAVCVLACYAAVRRGLVVRQVSFDGASVQHLARQQTILVETLRAAHVIKAYGAERLRKTAYDGAVSPAVHYQACSQRLAGLVRAGWMAAAGAQSIVAVAIALYLVQIDILTIGMLYAVIVLNTLLLQRGGSAIELFSQLGVLRVHVDRAAQLILPNPVSTSVPIVRSGRSGTLVVSNVSFSYSPREPTVLRDVSFRARAGEVVAITGSSGCGKSTLLKVVAGMLVPDRGSVTLGGQLVSPGCLGLVLQDDLLLTGSILDNITFFSPDPDVMWAEECAQMASILEDIEKMPMQMHTRVGESGSALSGGQRQRVMLARALYRKPSLLVLDEATSHLDATNERRIVATLRGLGITVIQAAHRKETLAGADVVIELKPNSVVNNLRTLETVT